MTFAAASAYILPFGKYRGQSIDAVAETDEGLRYLAWLNNADRTWRNHKVLKEHNALRMALKAYFRNEDIQRGLEASDEYGMEEWESHGEQ